MGSGELPPCWHPKRKIEMKNKSQNELFLKNLVYTTEGLLQI